MDLDWTGHAYQENTASGLYCGLKGGSGCSILCPRQGRGLFPLCTTARKYLNRHAGIAISAYKKIVGSS